MTSHIQPKASLVDKFNQASFKWVDLEDGQGKFLLASQVMDFISQAIAEAIQEERRMIVELIEEEKSKGYESNTILEGLVAELKVGRLIHHQE